MASTAQLMRRVSAQQTQIKNLKEENSGQRSELSSVRRESRLGSPMTLALAGGSTVAGFFAGQRIQRMVNASATIPNKLAGLPTGAFVGSVPAVAAIVSKRMKRDTRAVLVGGGAGIALGAYVEGG